MTASCARVSAIGSDFEKLGDRRRAGMVKQATRYHVRRRRGFVKDQGLAMQLHAFPRAASELRAALFAAEREPRFTVIDVPLGRGDISPTLRGFVQALRQRLRSSTSQN
jgi:hypothetical protein